MSVRGRRARIVSVDEGSVDEGSVEMYDVERQCRSDDSYLMTKANTKGGCSSVAGTCRQAIRRSIKPTGRGAMCRSMRTGAKGCLDLETSKASKRRNAGQGVME